jgi:hypothetical protein
MVRWKKYLLFLPLLAACASTSSERFVVEEQGEFDARSERYAFRSNSTDVLARLGTVIGFRYRYTLPEGQRPVPLTIVWRIPAPGYIKPTTRRTELATYSNQNCRPRSACGYQWRFDHPYELVPGEWIAEVHLRNQKLGEVRFSVRVE